MAMSKEPRIDPARMPAFFPPLSATVATGTPPGIWSTESTESHPSMELEDLMGTPMTGSGVSDAIIPGKCAAPPAPAMMTLRPRSAAWMAYCTIRNGVRCAETTVSSKGIPNSSSISEAAFMIWRSLSLPMMIPTSGLLISVFLCRGDYCPMGMLLSDGPVPHFGYRLLLQRERCGGGVSRRRFFTDNFQRILYLMRFIDQILFFAAEDRNVPHLPSGPRVFLPIDMHEHIVHLKHFVETVVDRLAFTAIFADKIDDGSGQDGFRIAQRIAQHHPP